MVSFYGDYNLTETVNIPFNTFSSDDPSASVTVTDLVAGDIYVHKDGVEGTPTGITVSLNVGAVNGNHLAILDLSDTNDAGFYAVGARYQVRMEGVTIDGATINAWIGAFSIGCTLRPTTLGRTLDVNATGEAGLDLDNTSGTIDAAQLGADCITSAKIADDAISAEHLNTGALTADVFAADALVAATFATGAFTADAFAANALVAATFAASSLDGKGDWNTTKTGYTLTNLSDANAAKLEDMLDGTGATLTLSNNLEVDLVKIHGTALTETDGQLAGRFVNFFDQGSAAFNVATALSSFKATGFSTFDASSDTVDVGKWLGTAVNADTAGYPKVTVKSGTGTGEIGLSAGTVASVNELNQLAAQAKADVEAECVDALESMNLDHLCKVATAAADMTTEVVDNSILSRILANGDTSAFVPSTDGLQPIRDRGDAAWITATGFSTLSAAQVNEQVLDVMNVDTLIDGKTFVESQRIIAAGVIGKVSGAGTGTEPFKGLDGATTRATVTVDDDGNRTAVVYG